MSRLTTAETVKRFQDKSTNNLSKLTEIDPPSWLSETGVQIWNEILPEILHTAKAIDMSLFAQMCASYGMAVESQLVLQAQGLVLTNSHGSRKNPAYQVWRDSVSTFNLLAQQFGLSPASRVKMSSSGIPSEGSSSSPTAALIEAARNRSIKAV